MRTIAQPDEEPASEAALLCALLGLLLCGCAAYPTRTLVSQATSPDGSKEISAYQLQHRGLPVDQGGLVVEVARKVPYGRMTIIEHDDWHTDFVQFVWLTPRQVAIAGCGAVAGDTPSVDVFDVADSAFVDDAPERHFASIAASVRREYAGKALPESGRACLRFFEQFAPQSRAARFTRALEFRRGGRPLMWRE